MMIKEQITTRRAFEHALESAKGYQVLKMKVVLPVSRLVVILPHQAAALFKVPAASACLETLRNTYVRSRTRVHHAGPVAPATPIGRRKFWTLRLDLTWFLRSFLWSRVASWIIQQEMQIWFGINWAISIPSLEWALFTFKEICPFWAVRF